MKRLILIVLVLAFVTAQPSAQTQTAQRSVDRSSPIRSMLDTYCAGCHNSNVRAGGVAFSEMPLETIGDKAEIWEKAVRKMRGRQMPPPGSRQPSQAEVDAFISSLEGTLDSDAGATRRPVAGHVPIQRLTRTEYGIAVKDLLGVE